MDDVAREKVSAFLDLVGREGPSKTADELLAGAESDQALLLGALTALKPFGALRASDEIGTMVVSSNAGKFLRSLSALIAEDDQLIEDWARLGSQCNESEQVLERGVFFLAVIERRRSALQADRPLQEMIISKGVFKARSSHDEPVFLLILNERSSCYQFIGGALRGSENPATAMSREVQEEIPKGSPRSGRDFAIKAIREDAFDTAFVSPTFGTYIKFKVHYFHIEFKARLSLSANHCWVTLDELRQGQTAEGTRIVPAWDELGLSTDELLQLPLSIEERIELPAEKCVPAEEDASAADNPHPNTLGKSTLAALLIIAFTVGSLTFAANLAPRHFTEILWVMVPVLLIILAFVARAAGLIDAGQMVSTFRLGAGKSNE